MNAIPIRNVYYLLSYAWDILEEAEELGLELENLPRVTDLLTMLLVRGTQRLLRRGMDRGYKPRTDVLTTLRGRIDFGTSARRLLLLQAKAQCDFEEFLPDLLHNQILKTTLHALSGCPEVAIRQRAEIHAVLRRLDGISRIDLKKSTFAQVSLHRNNAHYRLLMHICEFVHDNFLVNEQDGQRSFRDFLRDEPQMAKLFESFIANYYRKETDWAVTTQERIPWDSPTPNDLLPEMHADAVLRGSGRVVIVECKFYKEMLQANPWGAHSKFRSDHLYQLGAYLANLHAAQPVPKPEGLLVYPAITNGLLEDLSLSGMHVRICTLNLAEPWESVASQLNSILTGQLAAPAISGISS